MKTRSFATVALLLAWVSASLAPAEDPPAVSDLKITTLSTMLTEFRGLGEWGYAALIEVDGHTLLFDTGARPETVLANAAELGIELSEVDTVILSHNHWDHTGGLTTLRAELREKNPDALATTHVGEGIFLPRALMKDAMDKLPAMPPEFVIPMTRVREGYEELGGQFIVHANPHEVIPGVWVTGPIARVHAEKNWTPFMQLETEDGLIEDTIPEDQALVINTDSGLVIVAGCGHAGIVNTMEQARTMFNNKNVHAVMGGFHLLSATNEHLDWTGTSMRDFGVQHFIGAHCTGIYAVHRLREAAGLDRKSAVVGAVGSTFTLENGIAPGFLTR